jgi:hypothetical protein
MKQVLQTAYARLIQGLGAMLQAFKYQAFSLLTNNATESR